MSSREEIRKFMDTEQSIVQKAKRYDRDVKYLLDQLWRDEHTHAECEARMYSSANVSNTLQIALLSKIMDIVKNERSDVFESIGDMVKLAESSHEYTHGPWIPGPFDRTADGWPKNDMCKRCGYTIGSEDYGLDAPLCLKSSLAFGKILKLVVEYHMRPSAC